ncbi:MAG: hypothetical protein M1290_04500 [Candidatus Thermoplasmatota archaeon]|jgi:hypothetical protein|nr:hypothetical protein [Candidatus Thermoplasmatota archaeon]
MQSLDESALHNGNEEFIEKISRFSELVISDEISYIRRKMRISGDDEKLFYEMLNALSNKLLDPIIESLRVGGSRGNLFAENLRGIIDRRYPEYFKDVEIEFPESEHLRAEFGIREGHKRTFPKGTDDKE